MSNHDRHGSGRYASERGPFAIKENPTLEHRLTREHVDQHRERIADGWGYEPLTAKHGEKAVRDKIADMVRAHVGGFFDMSLFTQKVANGMDLGYVWFGPNFPLQRHSHPNRGDCLYFIIAGQIVMGRRQLNAGSTLFIPNGQPYKFSAGPAGVELLEFRIVGEGDPDAPGMALGEKTLDAMDDIIERSYENEHLWQLPERIGDTAIRQAVIDGRIPEGLAE